MKEATSLSLRRVEFEFRNDYAKAQAQAVIQSPFGHRV